MNSSYFFKSIVSSTWFCLVLMTTAMHGADREGSFQIERKQIRQAIISLAKLTRARYAIADLAEKTALSLEKNLATGKYYRFKDPGEFAAVVTSDLQLASGDRHFRFGFRPADRKAQKAPQQKTEEENKRERGHLGTVLNFVTLDQEGRCLFCQ